MNQFDRAQAARRLLDEPLIVDALESLERRSVDEMLAAPAFSIFGDRKRRRLADRVNAIRALRSELEMEIALGNQAARPTMDRP
ncbi:hypothetical protein [Mesorhizobium sp. A556]